MAHLDPTNNDELSEMFPTLQNGVEQMQHHLHHPDCWWLNCDAELETVKELHEDCMNKHVDNMGGEAPTERQYMCKWDGCKRSEF